ncbi:MAG: glycosyltransferase family 4 protein [Candidatus Hydrogenedentota bacterium]
MKLAILKGNRFNPWHLRAFTRLPDADITAFHTQPDMQRHHQDTTIEQPFAMAPIWLDTQAGFLPRRIARAIGTRYFGRPPDIVPFNQRLKGFDLIQTWELFTGWSEEAILAKRRDGTPVCVMVWDNIPFNMERAPGRRERKARVGREADRFLVHTERSRRTLDIEGVDQARVIKLDPGVDTQTFSPGPATRAVFGLDEESFVILFDGWLLPRKGIDFLLLALRELVRGPALHARPVQLLVVGAGPGRDRVHRLAARLGVAAHCTFAGPLPYARMPDAFRTADVFVLPSIATPEWQEPFAMAMLEAMSCGTPVVSTYSGAIPEMVEDTAQLCQPNDFLALYEVLRAIIEDAPRRRELGEQGRELALRRYHLDRYTADLARVYNDLLG